MRRHAIQFSQRELFVIWQALRVWSSVVGRIGHVEFSTLQATLRQSNEPEIQESQPLQRKQRQRVATGAIVGGRWRSVLLAAITWLVFGQTLHHQFVNYDDADYVLKNAQVARGLTLEGIVWAFTHVHS